MKLRHLLNEASLPRGFFVAEKDFQITPGGGWRMSIKAGDILKASPTSLEIWNPMRGRWVHKSPPISGVDQLDISGFAGSDGMLRAFMGGTKKLSQAQVVQLTKNAKKEKIFKNTKEAMKFLKTLPPNTGIKITLGK